MGAGASAETVQAAVQPDVPTSEPAPRAAASFELKVVSKARQPFCKLSTQPAAEVWTVIAKVARKARVAASEVKLTYRGLQLQPEQQVRTLVGTVACVRARMSVCVREKERRVARHMPPRRYTNKLSLSVSV